MKNLILLILFLHASISFAEIIPGGDSAPAQFPSGLTINGNQTLSYEETVVAADGDLSGGNFLMVKVGKIVTITCDAILTHASSSGPASSVGIVPASFRPAANTRMLYANSGTFLATMDVTTDGQITFFYREYSSTTNLIAQTDIYRPCTISYVVP